jgi:hypothetical protein
VTVGRAARLPESARKIRAPFELDPSLCIYSPQDNRDALDHPTVAAWLEFVATAWAPTPVDGTRARLALLLPCTKYKPYPTSREHRAVNAALLGAGWRPTGRPVDAPAVPAELLGLLGPGERPELLDVSPLARDGVVLDRFVVSEPLALVPYEHVMWWRGRQSPAASYDDPGLFEARGTSVSPERPDCTAVEVAPGRWRWGPAERDAYVDVHERLVTALAIALARLRPSYAAMVAWVSPGLTHRSFLADRAQRRRERLPAGRIGAGGRRALRGVLDLRPGIIDVLPGRHQLDDAAARLADRLAREGRKATPGVVRSTFARGDGADTPLGLPETLDHLLSWLDGRSRAVVAAP